MRPGSQQGGRSPFGCAATAVVATPRSGANRFNSEGSSSPGKRRSGSLLAGAAATSLQERRPFADASTTSSVASTPRVQRSNTTGATGQSLVSAMKTIPRTKTLDSAMDKNPRRRGEESDGEDSDDARSQSSNVSKSSNLSTLSTMSSSHAGGRNHSGSSSASSKSIHMSVSGDCSIDIEQQNSSDKSKMSLCTDFRQLCGEGTYADGLMECLQMYGFETPNKLQQHALPTVLHFMGKQLGGTTGTIGKGKSCIVIQGPEKSGKTTSVILGLLASIDVSLQQPQAILLSSSPKRDFDKFLNVFTLMQSVTYQSFMEEDADAVLEERSPKVRAARTSHILIGHPKQMLGLISSVPTLCLDSVRALVIDDAEDLLYSGPSLQSPSPDVADASTESKGANKIDEIVQICNVLECRQYSQNMADTYKIRAGKEQSMQLRYVILSQPLKDPASRKVMRALKSSMMSKQNLFGKENSGPPAKIIKAMKHYFAQAPRSEWVRIFSGLVQTLMFPRALIFCDEENIADHARLLREAGVAVSVNSPDGEKGANGEALTASEARRRAVQDFTSNKTQFLLTRSEPAVCQIMLPKVSCVFHFGVPAQMPSVYGVRLLPLDLQGGREASSILFLEPSKPDKNGAARGATGFGCTQVPPVISSLSKLFEINFLDMPFEFLPATPVSPSSGRPSVRRRA